MVHRPQRSERKDPFPNIPFDVDTSVPGDFYVGVVCIAAVLLLALGWLW